MVYAESRGSFPSGMASGFLSLADRSAFLYYRPPPKKLRCIIQWKYTSSALQQALHLSSGWSASGYRAGKHP